MLMAQTLPKRFFITVFLFVFLITTVTPALPAEAASGFIIDVDASTCDITTTFIAIGIVDDTGTGFDLVEIQIYDDGALVSSRKYRVAIGERRTITDVQTWYGPVGSEPAGIGVILTDTPGFTTLDSRGSVVPPTHCPAKDLDERYCLYRTHLYVGFLLGVLLSTIWFPIFKAGCAAS
jgi:hypothetical protein